MMAIERKGLSNKELDEKWNVKSLLGTSNFKTQKGEKYGYRTWILHLAPANISGNNVCPSASIGCAAACLNTSGLGCQPSVINARAKRTEFYFGDREAFMLRLEDEIRKAIANAERAGLTPTFRLNGTSDIKWEKIMYGPDKKNIFQRFPNIQFYDYTKIPNRGKKPEPNYQIVFSRSEDNERFVKKAMEQGQNVAVVFDKKSELPNKWGPQGGMIWNVIDGDRNDLRFLDPPKSVVGLSAKGRATRDTTGFVLYGTGVIDVDNLKEYRKRAQKDPSILGQRKIDGEKFVPIQSKVSRASAERTAELLRTSGRKARIVEHKPTVGGKSRKAWAVYTPGVYARTKSGATVGLLSRPSRKRIPTVRSY